MNFPFFGRIFRISFPAAMRYNGENRNHGKEMTT